MTVRYRSSDEDSGRWDGFPVPAGRHRDQHPVQERHHLDADDLRAAGVPDPGPAARRWPSCRPGWTGWSCPADEVVARLAAQRHRRFIKTHTPLDGIPLDPRATYIVVGPAPARHGGVALPPGRQPRPGADPPSSPAQPPPAGRHRRARRCGSGCRAGSSRTSTRASAMDSLPGVMWHLSDAWAAPARAERRARALRTTCPPTSTARCAGSPRGCDLEPPTAAELVEAAGVRADAGPRRASSHRTRPASSRTAPPSSGAAAPAPAASCWPTPSSRTTAQRAADAGAARPAGLAAPPRLRVRAAPRTRW